VTKKLGKVKKRMCIPKKNERVLFVEKHETFFFFFFPASLHTITLLGKIVHFFRSNVNWFLDDVSCFSQPLKKKGRRMRFEGECLVE